MRWVRDLTGRFPQRPHYDQKELDNECEQIILSFLREKYGECHLPISTDDLSIMVEHDTSNLDLYADLSPEGEDIEGLTDFFPDKKPVVKIAKELSLQSWRQNRLRTTLTHEYGHVKFHAFLWNFNQPKLIPDSSLALGPRCKRGSILDAPITDWMEWQAGYVCGSILMPLTFLQKLVQSAMKDWGLYSWIPVDSDHARELIARVSEVFDVSNDAARVRLIKLGYLLKIKQGANIFGD